MSVYMVFGEATPIDSHGLKQARLRMVQDHLMGRGIDDRRVLEAMGELPRESFVGAALRSHAYDDRPLEIDCQQTISQPFIVALGLQTLGLTGDEKVLEIGTGSGYQTALLSRLARSVYSIEWHHRLWEAVSDRFKQMALSNVHLRLGDGAMGWSDESPFDRIILSAAASMIPPPLEVQLHMNGKLLIPLGDSNQQVLTLATRSAGRWVLTRICDCVFVPLKGPLGAGHV